ncbi:MAG: NADH-quinone oxidoreductase subunit K [Candidatus Margulisiibacteriota bacterium]
MIIYLACIALLLIGIYCVAVKKNLIKIIIGLVIMEYAVNLFLVVLGYRRCGVDPIVLPGMAAKVCVDPMLQAMALSVIMIGLATTLLLVAIAMRIYERFGTFDITKIRNLKG